MIQLQSLGPTISVNDIDDFEHQIGFLLPNEYRDFLLNCNGGVPEKYPTIFHIAGEKNLERYLHGELSANSLSGYPSTPEGFIWHHVEDETTLQQVPFDIHLITGRHKSISQFQQGDPEPDGLAVNRVTVVPRLSESTLVDMPKDALQVFFRMNGPVEITNLGWCYQALSKRIARDLLPVASDGSGSLICIALSGDDRGVVYFWDWYREEAPPSYKNLSFIAESFSQFLEELTTK